jgi:hypothetical protein
MIRNKGGWYQTDSAGQITVWTDDATPVIFWQFPMLSEIFTFPAPPDPSPRPGTSHCTRASRQYPIPLGAVPGFPVMRRAAIFPPCFASSAWS